MSEENTRTKQLQVGRTVISNRMGKVKGRYQQVSVLYGNLCEDLVDGVPKQLREDIYDKLLNDFLMSEEGQEYIIPTKDEMLEAKISVKNKLLDYMAYQEKKEKEEEEKAKVRQQDEKRLDDLHGIKREDDKSEQVSTEKQDIKEEDTSIKTESINDVNETEVKQEKKKRKLFKKKKKVKEDKPEDKNDELIFIEDITDDKENVKADNKKPSKALLILIIINIICTIGLVILFLFGDIVKANIMSNFNMGELVINESTYVVPLSSIDVKDGETGIVFYAITTENNEGVISHDAYPIGEWVVNSQGQMEIQTNE